MCGLHDSGLPRKHWIFSKRAHLFGTNRICGSSQRCIQYIKENAYWHTFYFKFSVTQFVELHKCTLSQPENVDTI